MSDRKDRIHALKFAGLLCVICCTLITAASAGLKGFQLKNMELDRQKNILRAAAILKAGADPSANEIKRLYHDKIKEISVDDSGKVIARSNMEGEEKGGGGNMQNSPAGRTMLPLYLYMGKKTGEVAEGAERGKGAEGVELVKAYVIPIESRGLWGKIRGYLAFENDGVTVAGFTVYSHSETPGLGGEIEKQWFGRNFTGKRIVNSSGEFVSVAIARGAVENLPGEKRDNYVDGISGATLTGKYLSRGIRENLEQYEAISVKFRQGKHIGNLEK